MVFLISYDCDIQFNLLCVNLSANWYIFKINHKKKCNFVNKACKKNIFIKMQRFFCKARSINKTLSLSLSSTLNKTVHSQDNELIPQGRHMKINIPFLSVLGFRGQISSRPPLPIIRCSDNAATDTHLCYPRHIA